MGGRRGGDPVRLVTWLFAAIFLALTVFALIATYGNRAFPGRHERTNIADEDRTPFEDPRRIGPAGRYQASRFSFTVRTIDIDVILDIPAPTTWPLRTDPGTGRIRAIEPQPGQGEMVIGVLCFRPCEADDDLDIDAQRQTLRNFGLDRDEAVRDEPIIGGWLVEMEPDGVGTAFVVQRYDEDWPVRVSCHGFVAGTYRREIDELIGACAAIEARFP